MKLRATLLAFAFALTACTDGGPLVGPGALRVTLDSPNGDEGAAVLLLVGEGVVRASSTSEAEVYFDTSGETTRVVVVHPTGGALEFAVDMVERSRPLAVLVQEVAGPDDVLRRDLSAYRVELAR